MRRDHYDIVFRRAINTLSQDAIEAWAIDLLAMGPLAQWAEQEEIDKALQGMRVQTDAGKAVYALIMARDDRKNVLDAAMALYGRREPHAVLEVLYARSLAEAQRALLSGTPSDTFMTLYDLDRRTAVSLLSERFIGSPRYIGLLDDMEYEDPDPLLISAMLQSFENTDAYDALMLELETAISKATA